MIEVLRAAERVARPWKNGGGVTREVAVSPVGSSFENFDWRVSIAELRESGEFSRFENVDRALIILKGRLILTFAGQEAKLGPDSAPFAFSGDVPCFGAPVDGAVTDLNVMTRRGRATAQVMAIADGAYSASGKSTLLLGRNEAKVRLGRREFHLAPLDALLIDEPAELALDGAAFMIAIA